MLSKTLHFIRRAFQRIKLHHSQLEDFLIKDEQDAEFRVKKKVLFYHTHVMLIYFTLMPFLSPYITIKRAMFNIFATFCQFFLIKSKNFLTLIIFVVGSALFTIIVSKYNPEDFLRILGIILTHHNQTLLLPNSVTLKIIMIVVSLFLVNNIQIQLSALISEGNWVMMEHAVKGIQYSWPLLYLVNQVSAIYLTQACYQAFRESRDAQNCLRIANQELSAANNKLKATLTLLEKTNKELTEAVKSRELFIASVSHELRNPLNSMLGNIELLILEVKDSKWLEMLEICKTCGGILLGLVNNILDVAKISAEKLELSYVPTNLYALIERVWTISTIKIREKKLKGYLGLSANLPKLAEIDSHRLNQILLNLIGNAIKFTEAGFLKVVVTWHQNRDNNSPPGLTLKYPDNINIKGSAVDISSTKAPNNDERQEMFVEDFSETNINEPSLNLHDKIPLMNQGLKFRTLSAVNLTKHYFFTERDTKLQESISKLEFSHARGPGFLKIEVIDSGCGISESAMHCLFQAFSQGDPSVTRQFGGTGLGLYITKQLVEKMGGQIQIHSKEGLGSHFSLFIPVLETSQQETIPEDIQQEEEEEHQLIEELRQPTEKLNALVVDDDPFNQKIMKNYLNKLNFNVEVASNGLEGVSMFRSSRGKHYSLITMDIQMPKMDGLTACREIRKYESRNNAQRNVPILLVTGNCIDIEKNRDLDPNGEVRASCFFTKPFTFGECKAFVKTMSPRRRIHN